MTSPQPPEQPAPPAPAQPAAVPPQPGHPPQPGYPPPPGYGYPPPAGYAGTPPPGYGYPPPPPGYGYPPPGYPIPPPPPPVTPGGKPLAEFGDRLLAYLIDYAILFAVCLLILIPVFFAQFSIMMGPMDDFERRFNNQTEPDPGEFFGEFFTSVLGPLLGLYAAAILIILLIQYIYHVELMFRSGQTVGKRVMKVQVVTLDPEQSVTRMVATKRWLVESVAATFIPGLVYLDGLWQLWDKPYRQCLHDKFAATTVVKVSP